MSDVLRKSRASACRHSSVRRDTGDGLRQVHLRDPAEHEGDRQEDLRIEDDVRVWHLTTGPEVFTGPNLSPVCSFTRPVRDYGERGKEGVWVPPWVCALHVSLGSSVEDSAVPFAGTWCVAGGRVYDGSMSISSVSEWSVFSGATSTGTTTQTRGPAQVWWKPSLLGLGFSVVSLQTRKRRSSIRFKERVSSLRRRSTTGNKDGAGRRAETVFSASMGLLFRVPRR